MKTGHDTNSKAETSYPAFMLSICIIGDFLKGILSLLLVTLPISIIFSIFLTAIFYIWAFTMGGFASIKDNKMRKDVMAKVLKRSALRVTVGMLPLISLIPWTAISVHQVWVSVNRK